MSASVPAATAILDLEAPCLAALALAFGSYVAVAALERRTAPA